MEYVTAQEIRIAEQNAKYIDDVKQLMLQPWLEHTNSGFSVNLRALLEEIDPEDLESVGTHIKRRLTTPKTN